MMIILILVVELLAELTKRCPETIFDDIDIGTHQYVQIHPCLTL